jgi:hypothetical protein
MPLENRQVTLSNTTVTEIVSEHNMPHNVTLHNLTKSSNEYIHYGNADMTLTNSPHIDPGETLTIELGPGDVLYAMSDPNGLVVGVLDIRKSQ